jgi:hypothetical protein
MADVKFIAHILYQYIGYILYINYIYYIVFYLIYINYILYHRVINYYTYILKSMLESIIYKYINML